jgi:SurA-like N-terminal domain
VIKILGIFMKKIAFFLLLLAINTITCIAHASDPIFNKSQESGIGVKNAILAKVNGKTISVIDVMKKMDITFHKNFPHLADSKQAKYQFYLSSWKHVLNEIVDSQLILADAESKEIKIEDAEIRKEVDKKFGPNIMLTLDQIGITYDEAWEIIKEELLVQRMSWFRVNAKAFQAVTPEEIKKEYIKYCEENPPKKEWEYETISIRSDNKILSEKIAKNITEFIQHTSDTSEIKKYIEKLENSEENCTIAFSNSYKVQENELSLSYKNVLQSLKKNTFSEPQLQPSKNKNSYCYRLFHLKDFIEENKTAFENLYNKLEERILQRSVAKESKRYLEKLRDFYCYDQQKIVLKEDFTPFVLE